jgi:hypothetical protein
MPVSPDWARDVIVRHVKDADGERWMVFVGAEKRSELSHSQSALVFARLLADLNQGRVWVAHGESGAAQPLDHNSLRGCTCC